MKKLATILLQITIVLIGIGVLSFMLWEPQVEGVNANATNFEIYFKDPFLAYVYFSSILFFVSLYQVSKIVRFMGRNELITEHTAKALRTVKYCMLTLAGLIAAAVVYLAVTVRGEDDIAGGVAVALFLILIAVTTSTIAALSERKLRRALGA